MKISARNQLKCTVKSIQEGAVNAVVTLDLHGKAELKANITMAAVEDLGLAEGKECYALIKASNVLVAAGEKVSGISARNQLTGTVSKVCKGAVNGSVAVTLGCGKTILTASITNEAIESLGLAEGAQATVIVKSTDIMVAVD